MHWRREMNNSAKYTPKRVYIKYHNAFTCFNVRGAAVDGASGSSSLFKDGDGLPTSQRCHAYPTANQQVVTSSRGQSAPCTLRHVTQFSILFFFRFSSLTLCLFLNFGLFFFPFFFLPFPFHPHSDESKEKSET